MATGNALSDYAEDLLLDDLLRSGTVYVALYTSNPGEDNSGTEVSASGYARQEITFPAASGGQSANSADVTFPTALAPWGTITHIGIMDALTTGHLLMYGPVSVPTTINTSGVFLLPAGTVVASLD